MLFSSISLKLVIATTTNTMITIFIFLKPYLLPTPISL